MLMKHINNNKTSWKQILKPWTSQVGTGSIIQKLHL